MTAYLQHAWRALHPIVDSINATVTDTSKMALTFPPHSFYMPPDLYTFLALLASESALEEWLKFMLISWTFTTCRRWFFTVWYWMHDTAKKSLYTHVSFREGDETYTWMMFWLSRQKFWNKVRDVKVSKTDTDGSGRKVNYCPSASRTFSTWINWHCVIMTFPADKDSNDYYDRDKRGVLQLSILSISRSVLPKMIEEARRAYEANIQAGWTTVWFPTTGYCAEWAKVATCQKRNLASVILDPGLKQLLLDDARDFLRNQKWYTDRGIPFRRGYLLYGAPGSGKTSLIRGLAGELDLSIYMISLSGTSMDDNKLAALMRSLPERCIAVLEDIDAAFTHGLNRDSKDDEWPGRRRDGVTLNGLLNALDGIGAQEGRILFATTNKYAALDEALRREGRMDIHIEFKLASKYQARELFRRFYDPTDPAEGELTEDDSTSTENTPGASSSLSGVTIVGAQHNLEDHKLSAPRIDQLASSFAELIPEDMFSMAALQGYLMRHKVNPIAAVDGAGAWVQEKTLVKEDAKKEEEEEDVDVDVDADLESRMLEEVQDKGDDGGSEAVDLECPACRFRDTGIFGWLMDVINSRS